MTITAREVWEKMKPEHRPPISVGKSGRFYETDEDYKHISDSLATLALVGRLVEVLAEEAAYTVCDYEDDRVDEADDMFCVWRQQGRAEPFIGRDALSALFSAYASVFLQESSA